MTMQIALASPRISARLDMLPTIAALCDGGEAVSFVCNHVRDDIESLCAIAENFEASLGVST